MFLTQQSKSFPLCKVEKNLLENFRVVSFLYDKKYLQGYGHRYLQNDNYYAYAIFGCKK